MWIAYEFLTYYINFINEYFYVIFILLILTFLYFFKKIFLNNLISKKYKLSSKKYNIKSNFNKLDLINIWIWYEIADNNDLYFNWIKLEISDIDLDDIKNVEILDNTFLLAWNIFIYNWKKIINNFSNSLYNYIWNWYFSYSWKVYFLDTLIFLSDATTFNNIWWWYAKDINFVYYNWVILNKINPLLFKYNYMSYAKYEWYNYVNGINASNVSLSDTWNMTFYDLTKNNNLYKHRFSYFTKSKILNTKFNYHSIINWKVFTINWYEILWVDINSFSEIDEIYSFDKSYLYKSWNIIAKISIWSFEYISNWYFKNNWWIFFEWYEISWADLTTFSVVWLDYAFDIKWLYYKWILIKDNNNDLKCKIIENSINKWFTDYQINTYFSDWYYCYNNWIIFNKIY